MGAGGISKTNRDRARDILARHEAGEIHANIGADYGISRERVRQIVKSFGGAARRSQFRDQNQEIAAALESEWLTIQQAADRFGVAARRVWIIARERGIETPKRDFAEEMRLKFLAARVRAGASIRSTAGGDERLEARLWYYCRQHGIQSTSRSGRRAVPEGRPAHLRDMRLAGLTWRECSERLAEIEGTKPVAPAALSEWCRRNAPDVHGIEIPRARRYVAPKPRPPRPAKVVVPDPDIIVRDTIRETALANRGRLSATKIAKALGVTRNSIIGHWWRARQSGEVSA